MITGGDLYDLSERNEEHRKDLWVAFIGMAIGIVIYLPIGMLVFDNSIGSMGERAYYFLAGAGGMLFCNWLRHRKHTQ